MACKRKTPIKQSKSVVRTCEWGFAKAIINQS